MGTLDLQTAVEIASNAIRIARESGVKPLAAVVLDAAAHPLAILRDEQASFLRPQFAAPPLLNELVMRGELPAAMNFWHYTARLSAAGMKELITMPQT